MGSFSSYIKRLCTQTVVHWSSIGSDGYGGQGFATPVEIKCRWAKVKDLEWPQNIDKEEAANAANMKIISRTRLKVGDFIYLGVLQDLSEPNNPVKIEEAYKIIYESDIPTVSGRENILEYLL